METAVTILGAVVMVIAGSFLALPVAALLMRLRRLIRAGKIKRHRRKGS